MESGLTPLHVMESGLTPLSLHLYAPLRPAKKDAFIQSATGGAAVNVAAHELGHILGLPHNDTNTANLMHSTSQDGCVLDKNEWDIVNP